MNVACCNHVSSIDFSEFGKKNGPFWPISDEVIPPGRPTQRRNKIYFAEIGLLLRW